MSESKTANIREKVVDKRTVSHEEGKNRNLARSRRRQGRPDNNLKIATKIARHNFHHAIKKCNKRHWTEFLGKPTNIWKAAQYLDPGKRFSFGRISVIKGRQGEAIQDKAGMAKELLHNFFLEPPVPRRPDNTKV